MAKAALIEIFDSIQGEGRFVGCPTTFVRTATCPLRCLYCDTPNSYEAPARVPVRRGGRVTEEANPLTAARVAELVRERGRGECVSVTGGEPLVFPEFVAELGAALRPSGPRLHLETAAIDPDALARCVDAIDHLSADYKLPATLGAPVGGPPVDEHGGYGGRHVLCCELARAAGVSIDVKLVLTTDVTDAALLLALQQLESVRDAVLLVLQPVTPFAAVTAGLPSADLARHCAAAVDLGFEVRVLPQVHKHLGLP